MTSDAVGGDVRLLLRRLGRGVVEVDSEVLPAADGLRDLLADVLVAPRVDVREGRFQRLLLDQVPRRR